MNQVTLLIVEDNELNRDMLSRRLKKCGFDTLIASDGKEGIELAGKNKPDLILMDMGLPVTSGWEASQILKSGPDTAHIPIIGLSAHAMPGDREKALKSGCDDYDIKPVRIERLLGKIKDLLEID